MAFIGLRYPVFAPIKTCVDGSAPTYEGAVVMGRAMSATVELTRNTATLYADDILDDSDNSITGGTISLGLNDVADEAQAVIFGTRVDPETGEVTDIEDSAPYGGFGYIRVRHQQGVLHYVAYWIYKTQFGMGGEEGASKQQSTEFTTPTLTGNIMGVYPDNTGKAAFRVRKQFESAEAAKAWINSKSGLNA